VTSCANENHPTVFIFMLSLFKIENLTNNSGSRGGDRSEGGEREEKS